MFGFLLICWLFGALYINIYRLSTRVHFVHSDIAWKLVEYIWCYWLHYGWKCFSEKFNDFKWNTNIAGNKKSEIYTFKIKIYFSKDIVKHVKHCNMFNRIEIYLCFGTIRLRVVKNKLNLWIIFFFITSAGKYF